MLDCSLEYSLISQGFSRIVGIDEVGRGCWAGPLVMAGYCFTPGQEILQNLNDSKQLSPKKRNLFSAQLISHPHKIYSLPAQELDKVGLAQGLHRLISQLVEFFDDGNTFFLIDGYWPKRFHIQSEHIIDGDAKSYSIAAASILAKVSRDRYMIDLAKVMPHYGFEQHKGYGTRGHRQALAKHGPCHEHRYSFSPIKKLAQQT